ncbi:MAG: hypothetical protein IKM02_06735 [Clostridia bacterium]|nr:hypothetical protein [Clostridia bacterium]
MNQTTSEGLRAYFKRVSGALTGLFNMAHAICGNYDLAEYALRSALLSVWQDNPQSGLGLQEKLRGKLRRVAVKVALSERGRRSELTWNSLRSPGTDPILDQAVQESQEIRRCLVLKYGCDLSLSRISRITGLPASQLKTVFGRFEARIRRRLPPRERRRFEGRIAQSMEDFLYTDSSEAPDNAALYRAFEAEAADAPVNSHYAARIIGRIALIVLAILCAFIFWLYAVISQPVCMENPESPAAAVHTAVDPEIPA